MFQIILVLILQSLATLCDTNSYIGAVVEFASVDSFDLPAPIEVLIVKKSLIDVLSCTR